MHHLTFLALLTIPLADNRLPTPQSASAELESNDVSLIHTVPQAPRARRLTVPKYGPAGVIPKNALPSPRSVGEAAPHSGFQARGVPGAAVVFMRGLFSGPKGIRLCPRH